MEKYIAIKFSELIKNKENFIFTKFGDGEYACMNYQKGSNCDNDSYTDWLGGELNKAFKFLSKIENAYLGKWHDKNVIDFLEKISENKNINWVHYHSVMNASPVDGTDFFDSFSNNNLLNLVKEVRLTKRKKIIVSNHKNSKLKEIFNADVFVEVSDKNWSNSYLDYERRVLENIEDDCIIITAAGMCSKVLISNLIKINESLTCIDIGSGFDLLATGHKSRPWNHSYEDELKYYKEILG